VTIALNTITIRHERRIRLGFTVTLAAGAFGAAGVPLYAVTSLDGLGASPTVKKALVIADSPNFVELQLGADLVQGALYSISAVGVPGTGGSGVTPDPSALTFRVATEQDPRAALGATRDALSAFEVQLYGLDLAFEGGDFAEGPDGDLATTGGVALVEQDLTSRLLGMGLPWDAAYGARLRDFVDGAPGALTPARARVIRELRQDDRVAKADATVDLRDPANPTITALPTLVGASVVGAAQQLQLRTTL